MTSAWPLAGLNGAALDHYIDLAFRLGGAKASAFAEGLRNVRGMEDARNAIEGWWSFSSTAAESRKPNPPS